MSALSSEVTIVPPPKTLAEAIAHLHDTSQQMATATDHLREIAERHDAPPEMRTVVINPGNNGVYRVVDQSAWAAKSIAILNPGAAAVYVGIGGISATSQARAPACPGSSALVLPVEVRDLELGCDAATLGASTAVVYLFRYVSLQPLVLRQVP